MPEARFSDEELKEIKRVRAWKGMVATEGWKEYQALLQTYQAQRGQDLMERVQGLDMAVSKVFDQGALWAFTLAKEVVTRSIAAVDEMIADRDVKPGEAQPEE